MATEKHKKEIRRISRFIREAEQRGYSFSDELKNSFKDYSTQKLQHLTVDKLYEQATYTYQGLEMSGTKGRLLERSMAAKKAAETRREITQENEAIAKAREERIKEEQEKELLRKQGFTEEGIILDNLLDEINSWQTAGALYLHNLLNSEIKKYSKEQVAEALSNMPPELIEEVKQVRKYVSRWDDGSGGSNLTANNTFRKLANFIKGTIDTKEEAKELGNIMDEMG